MFYATNTALCVFWLLRGVTGETQCYTCDWTETRSDDPSGADGLCDTNTELCPGDRVCVTKVKCRQSADTLTYKNPVRYLVQKACVRRDQCQNYGPEGWLVQNPDGNIVARSCCDGDLCNQGSGFELWSQNVGTEVNDVKFCIVGWMDDPGCGESRFEDAGELLSLPSSRIIGGAAARRYEFPYQGRLSYYGGSSFFCGAVLITKDWVATAAHCIKLDMNGYCYDFMDNDEYVENVEIIFGDHDRFESSSHEQIRRPALAIYHEDYDCSTIDNDIGLIKLDSSIDISGNKVRPICRPRRRKNIYDGETAVVSGWGRISQYSNDLADVLQYAPMKIITNDECLALWAPYASITPSMICATDGGDLFQRGHCSGDSGGPLAVKDDDGRFHLVGLVSWSQTGTCVNGRPVGYNRVNHFLDWIDSKIIQYYP